MTTQDPGQSALFDSLREPVFVGLDRVAVRTREDRATLSAWRLSVSAAQGEGKICLFEIRGGATLYRGEGIFLGWPQTQLEAAYRGLLPPATDPEPDAGQFG